MTKAPIVEVTAICHRGLLRAENQDCITVAGWVSDVVMSAPRVSRHSLAEPLLIAVADGMGGGPAGDIAARYAVKRLAMANLPTQDDIVASLVAINSELYHTMAAAPQLRSMGTTVVGLLLTTHRAIWFNVGDSRLYRHHQGQLKQLSIDDVPAGSHDGAITQALGGSGTFVPVAPHIAVETLATPSRWLLCSDGLTKMVGHEDLERAMETGDEDAARTLFGKAIEAGGSDNISIIVVSVGDINDIT
jgi:PPM family protein phosphatase